MLQTGPIYRAGSRITIRLNDLPRGFGVQPILGLLRDLPGGGFLRVRDEDPLEWLEALLREKDTPPIEKMLHRRYDQGDHQLMVLKQDTSLLSGHPGEQEAPRDQPAT